MREPVVSRTFKGFEVSALILNLETWEQSERLFFIERLPRTPRKVDLFIRERIESQLSEQEKFVTVLKKESKLKRYYMTEPEFISHAKEADLLPGAAQERED